MAGAEPEIEDGVSEGEVPLRDYVDARLGDLKEMLASKFEALALNLTVAKTETDRRLHEMNQFREENETDRRALASREYVDQRFRELEGRMGRTERGGKPGGD